MPYRERVTKKLNADIKCVNRKPWNILDMTNDDDNENEDAEYAAAVVAVYNVADDDDG